MLNPFDKDGLGHRAGYQAVAIAADKYQYCVPMPMTAVGGRASAPNT
jgi:hypothetical protein